ncbi:MAG: hypothetical protein WC881_09200 [Elusimicrobiota bacterium]|jgi:hypothetical protein
MALFDFYRVSVKLADGSSGKRIQVKGDICNRTARGYSAVSIRLILRNQDLVVANSLVVIYGISGGATKSFSQNLAGLEAGQHIDEHTKCYCQVESAF